MKYFFSVMVLIVTVTATAEESIIFLKKEKIKVGDKTILVEVAKSPQDMARGLMFRKSLKKDEGMLFVYDHEEIRSFWMKNTFIPLSIGFFDKNRELIDTHEMTPVKSEMQLDIPTYTSRMPAQYALEMPAGWFQKIHRSSKKKIKFDFLKE